MLAGFTADLNRQIDRVPAGRDIPPEMTFRQWCDRLAAEGLKVDGKPFRLDNRRSLFGSVRNWSAGRHRTPRAVLRLLALWRIRRRKQNNC